jgi:hypothetical protein
MAEADKDDKESKEEQQSQQSNASPIALGETADDSIDMINKHLETI